MKDQHEKITGCRDLNQDEIDLMNEIKAKGQELQALIDKVSQANQDVVTNEEAGDIFVADSEAFRWSHIARTHFQQGCMALVRAVAKPKGF